MVDKHKLEIPLAEMIQTLRSELNEAQKAGKDEEIQFELEKIDLELQVLISKSIEAGAGIKFHVVNAEAGATKSTENTHKFVLTMKPKSSTTDKAIAISDKDNEKLAEN